MVKNTFKKKKKKKKTTIQTKIHKKTNELDGKRRSNSHRKSKRKQL